MLTAQTTATIRRATTGMSVAYSRTNSGDITVNNCFSVLLATDWRRLCTAMILLMGIGCGSRQEPPVVADRANDDLPMSLQASLSLEEPGEVAFPLAAVFSPDGSQLAVLYNHFAPEASSRSQSIRLVDLGKSPATQTTIRLGTIDSSAYGVSGIGNTGVPGFTADGSRLLAIVPRWDPARPYLSVADAFSGTTACELELQSPCPVSAWSFSPDGGALAVCGEQTEGDAGGVLHVWELGSETLQFSRSFDEVTYDSVAFSPDSALLAVGAGVSRRNATSGEIHLYNAFTGDLLNTNQDFEFPVSAMLYTPDGDSIIGADLGGTIRVWSQFRDAPGVTESIDCGDRLLWQASKVAISPDGTLLAVALSNFNGGQNQGEVRLIDVVQKIQVGTPFADSPEPIDYVAFSPDGRLLATQSSNELTIWRVTESPDDVDDLEAVSK